MNIYKVELIHGQFEESKAYVVAKSFTEVEEFINTRNRSIMSIELLGPVANWNIDS